MTLVQIFAIISYKKAKEDRDTFFNRGLLLKAAQRRSIDDFVGNSWFVDSLSSRYIELNDVRRLMRNGWSLGGLKQMQKLKFFPGGSVRGTNFKRAIDKLESRGF